MTWPPDAVGDDDAVLAMAMVVLLRPGGLLLALPTGVISSEELQAASDQDGGTLLGPHRVFSVPGYRDDSQEPLDVEEEVEVMVVDMSTAIMPALATYSELDGATVCFSAALLPSPEPLLVMVRQWLLVQATTT